VNDLETRVREALHGLADEIGPPITGHEMPAPFLRAVRRRRARTIGLGLVIVAILAVGSVAGIRGLVGERKLLPAHPPPTPTQLAPLLRHHGEVALVSHGTLVGVDSKTGATRTLALCSQPCEYIDEPAWSPDGRWIAYNVSTCVTQLPCEKQAGIWVKGAAGGPRQVVSLCSGNGCGFGGSFAWAPDGSRLAYVQPVNKSAAIYVIDPGIFRRTRLSSSSGRFTQIAWSPDGTRIGYLLGGRVFVMDSDGSHQTPLTRPLGVDSFTWSPDGTKIELDAVGSDFSRIYVMNADGSDLRLLEEGTNFEGPGLPTWSPDGSRIAYVTTPGRSNHYMAAYWVVSVDGTKRIKLYQSACCSPEFDSPIWSPDGSRVALVTYAGHWYLASADGTGKLTPMSALVAEKWRQGA
jgi:Tol biopolymer transport system component